MNRTTNRTTIVTLIIVSLLILLACCCLLAVAGAVTYLRVSERVVEPGYPQVVTDLPPQVTFLPPSTPLPSYTPTAPQPRGATPLPGTPIPEGTETPLPAALSVSTETLQTLERSLVPANDPVDLARRLKGIVDMPASLPPQAPRAVGDRDTFWVGNSDTNEKFQVQAVLQYVTEHSYFWIQEGVEYDPADLQQLAETFESQIYPTDRQFFGSERTPGIDGDPHLYILYARGVGAHVAGYFSPADAYHPLAHEFSNAHEMFIFNADQSALDNEYTYATLAHELQHMIHWNRDVNEEYWLNEGFSDLAMLLNGYEVGGVDNIYAADTDLQLTTWAEDPAARSAHYGAAFLFVTYFLDRFGDPLTQAVVADPNNGLASLDEVLAASGSVDPATGAAITADDVFADWAVANWLQDPAAADGRYAYRRYTAVPQFAEAEQVQSCPAQGDGRTVSQYGVDYIRIRCEGAVTLRFEGRGQVPLLDATPHSGAWAFWSHNTDVSDTTLTRAFDFASASGPLTLQYWTWYDIEQDFDYAYVEASVDGGATWQILNTPSGTDSNPTGNSYGWGYTGESGGWIQEQVDISPFAGQQVLLRFEYLTDAGVTGEGLLLDDVAIPEIGYATDFETDTGGWEASGFARVQNGLPQTFRLAVIAYGQAPAVQQVTVLPGQVIEIPLAFDGDLREVVLAISGTTRFTRQKAAYSFSVR